MDRGRDLGPGAGARPDPRRRPTGGVHRARGLHQRPRPPARGRSTEKGGAAIKGSSSGSRCAGAIEPVDGECLGRSRGGLTTKLHLAVDARGRPRTLRLTEGQAGDNPQLLPLLDDLVWRTGRPGRPRTRPDLVVADKAYSHPSTRAALRRRGIGCAIPEKSDQKARRAAKGSRGGRPPAFDREAYRARNLVERCFNRLKQNRALATRYAKRAVLYRALVVIAAIRIWLK